MFTVTKDTPISEILEQDQSVSEFLMEMGMYCFGCPAALAETLGEACLVHGVDADEMAQKINEHIAGK